MQAHRTPLTQPQINRLIAAGVLPHGTCAHPMQRAGESHPTLSPYHTVPTITDALEGAATDPWRDTHPQHHTLAAAGAPGDTQTDDPSLWLATAPDQFDDAPATAHLAQLPADDGAQATRERTTAAHFSRLSHRPTPVATADDARQIMGSAARPTLRVVHGRAEQARRDAEYAAWAAEQMARIHTACAWVDPVVRPGDPSAGPRLVHPQPAAQAPAHTAPRPGTRRQAVRNAWEPHEHWLERVPLRYLALATVVTLATLAASVLWPWGFALPL